MKTLKVANMPNDSNKKQNEHTKIHSLSGIPAKTTAVEALCRLKDLQLIGDALDPLRNIRLATYPPNFSAATGMQELRTTGALQDLSDHESSTSHIMRKFSTIHQSWFELSRLMPDGATSNSYLGKLMQTTKLLGESFPSLKDAYPEYWYTSQKSGVSTLLDKIENINRHWQELLGHMPAASCLARKLEEMHIPLVKPLLKAENAMTGMLKIETLAKTFTDLSSQLFATGRLMAGIDYDAMSGHLGIESPFFADLEASVDNTLSAYENLTSSFHDIADIMRLPDFVLPEATNELYTTGTALRSLQPIDKEGDEEYIITLGKKAEDSECITLIKIDMPDLLNIYRGAKESICSSNPDRQRHVLSSLRQLFDNALWCLAPDDKIIPWIKSLAETQQKNLLKDGKPTRSARIEFICRDIFEPPLSDFIKADTQAFVKLYNVLNRIHAVHTGLSDTQLTAIMYKAESWLTFLIKIARENNRLGMNK